MGRAAPALLAIAAIAIAGPLATAIGFGTSGLGFLVAKTVIAMGVVALGSNLLGLNRAAGGDSVKSSPILANEASNIAAIPVVYGRRRVGGKRIYMNVSDNNQKLHIVMAVAEGEIGRFRKIYFNDELVIDMVGGSADPSGGNIALQPSTSGTITTTAAGISTDLVDIGDARICSKYRNYLRFEYRLGTTTQEHFGYLTTKFAEWTSAAQGKGIALVYFELTFNRDVYTQIPNITFEINGRRVRTVRSDLASTTSLSLLGSITTPSTTSLTVATGTQTLTLPTDYNYGYAAGDAVQILKAPNYMTGTVTSYNSTTGQLVANITSKFGTGTYTDWNVFNYTSWGLNAADVLHDYLTNTVYGKGLADSEIDLPSFKEAGEYCAEYVRENFGATSEIFTRYYLNGHLNPEDTVYDNVKKILAGFNGFLVYSNGLYYLKMNRPRYGSQTTNSNLYLFDESNMIGRYDLQLGTKQNRFNQVKAVHFDQNQLYNQNLVYYKNSTYVTQDNNQVLEREVEMPMVTDPRNVNYLSRLILNQSRYGMVINFTAPYSALQVEIADIIRITNDNLGFVEKLFRVLSIGLNVDGTIQITAMEYDDSLYTTGTLPELILPGTIIAEAGSSLYNAVVAPPTNLTATASNTTQADGTIISTIVASWTASASAAYYEVKIVGPVTQIYTTSGTSITIGPVANGTYVVSVTAINAFGNRSTEVF